MRKTIQFLGFICALVLLNSCYKSPDLGGLSSELVVATDVDLEVDFSTYTNYYLSDTIRIVTNSIKDDSIVVPPVSLSMIQEIESNMTDRGYTRSSDPQDVINSNIDIAIATSIIRITNTGQNCWGWWGGGYPGYWPPWGWGGGGYYYPYCSYYKFDTGTLSIEYGDLKNPDNIGRIPTMWNAAIFGVLSSYETTNIDRAVRGISQAFDQSQYIQKN